LVLPAEFGAVDRVTVSPSVAGFFVLDDVLVSTVELVAGPVTFTGNVVVDFPVGPGVLIVSDDAADVFLGSSPSSSGWNVIDIRFSYNKDRDTAYFGEMWHLKSEQLPRSLWVCMHTPLSVPSTRLHPGTLCV
jgi:hypothetical protein